MSRTLFLLRHAKSSWDEPLEDAARPLNGRGRRDAPRVGARFAAAFPALDAIVSSPAVRARSTALAFAEAAGFRGTIRFEPRIYEASAEALLELARALPAEQRRVLFVGHNPGLEAFVELATGRYVRMPTAALVELGLDGEWGELGLGRARLGATMCPKDER